MSQQIVVGYKPKGKSLNPEKEKAVISLALTSKLVRAFYALHRFAKKNFPQKKKLKYLTFFAFEDGKRFVLLGGITKKGTILNPGLWGYRVYPSEEFTPEANEKTIQLGSLNPEPYEVTDFCTPSMLMNFLIANGGRQTVRDFIKETEKIIDL